MTRIDKWLKVEHVSFLFMTQVKYVAPTHLIHGSYLRIYKNIHRAIKNSLSGTRLQSLNNFLGKETYIE